jgi:archaellum component FlaG (FlaF/FlaG flagellin family)
MKRTVRMRCPLGFLCLLLCGSMQTAYGQTSIFGPRIYTRNSGRPQPVTAQFSVGDPSGDFTLVVRNGGAQDGRVSSALIKVNGAVVVDPSEFNQQIERIEKSVSLRAQNEISVELRSAPGTSVEITILGSSTTPSTTEVISPAGGTITLGGIAVVFPSGAFPADTLVTVSLTSSEETREDFEVTAEIFSPGARLPFEIRINSGLTPPATPIKAVVNLPDSFLSSLPTDSEVQAFAQVFENGGEETLDSFELFPSSFDPTTKILSVDLPLEVFTAERKIDPSYEAIVIIGSTPTKPAAAIAASTLTESGIVQGDFGVEDLSASPAADILALEATECEGSSLGSPLEGDLKVNSSFDGKTHYGTDYAAANGDNVLAAADGKVFRIGFDARPLEAIPKPRFTL